jgi:putative DNA methylase
VAQSQKGVFRLLGLQEIPTTINPQEDNIWLLTHQLTGGLATGGLATCARIVLTVRDGGLIESARSLAYRLYNICERQKWANEALAYNCLVQSWPEIQTKSLDLRSALQNHNEDNEEK